MLRWKNFSVPAREVKDSYIRTSVYCRNRYTSHKRSFAVYMLSQKVGDFFAAPGLFCTIIEIEEKIVSLKMLPKHNIKQIIVKCAFTLLHL